ncbi:calcium-transporting ATPase 1, endoplasmic reticulum-type-like protein isoform X1, partial [Tanacetum coccineum]
VDSKIGLSDGEVKKWLKKILLGAAVISFVLAWYDGEEGGEMETTAFVEPLVIFLILIVNVIVGVWQESNAEKALEALKEIQSEQATVIRIGRKVSSLLAKELVPGDIVELRVGDKIPTDMRVISLVSSMLRVEQGSLTGESEVVSKMTKPDEYRDWNVKYFLSWEYVNGWPTNFKFSFEKCTYYFEIAVALAVAAIPEGLPAVITTCLALGTCKMAQKNALVRKLPSVETLGCTTVICSDKTGTTYNPHDGKIHDWPAGKMDTNLQTIAKIADLANDAGIEKSKKGYVATGLLTEATLKVLVEKVGLPAGLGSGSSTGYSDLMGMSLAIYFSSFFTHRAKFAHMLLCDMHFVLSRGVKTKSIIATLKFDRDRKSMGVIVKSKSGRNSLIVKSAVENLLERSLYIQLLDGFVVELDSKAKSAILNSLNELSSAALRVLGFAYKEDPPEFTTYDVDEDHPAHNLLLDPINYSSIESNLVFVSLAGLRDPPCKEVRQAIEDCKAAGIQVIVITGDNKNTARAKAEPHHKQEIVRLLKDLGEVVAMTCDGVNDAPALKLADIGIEMGIARTEVAKEASDLVLADDNFSTIVAAVGEGRSIYNNMKAFIRYMISSNIGEVASIFLTAAIGIPEGLIPVQLLWVNLVIDGPPATVLGFNPPGKYIMKKAPRRSDDSLISAWILFRYLVIGLYVGVATVGVFIIWYTHGYFMGIDLSQDGHSLVTYSQLTNWGQCKSWENFTVSPFTAGDRVFNFDSNPCDYFQARNVKAMTLSLYILVAIEMFNSLNELLEDESLLTMPPWVNPWLLLAMIVPLSLNEWLLVLAVALPVIFIDEILKIVGRMTSGAQTSPRPSKRKTE